jgi:hypothetical protein
VPPPHLVPPPTGQRPQMSSGPHTERRSNSWLAWARRLAGENVGRPYRVRGQTTCPEGLPPGHPDIKRLSANHLRIPCNPGREASRRGSRCRRASMMPPVNSLAPCRGPLPVRPPGAAFPGSGPSARGEGGLRRPPAQALMRPRDRPPNGPFQVIPTRTHPQANRGATNPGVVSGQCADDRVDKTAETHHPISTATVCAAATRESPHLLDTHSGGFMMWRCKQKRAGRGGWLRPQWPSAGTANLQPGGQKRSGTLRLPQELARWPNSNGWK